MYEEQCLATGIAAVHWFYDYHSALVRTAGSCSPHAARMQVSLEALKSMIEAIGFEPSLTIYSQFGGTLKVADFMAVHDTAMPSDEQFTFRLSFEGVDATSAHVGHDERGAWLFADRFGDSIAVSLKAEYFLD